MTDPRTPNAPPVHERPGPVRRLVLEYLDRIARRFHATGGLRHGDNYDIVQVAKFRAAVESADYYEANLLTSQPIETRLKLLSHAAALAQDGLVLEFGVASGTTITHLANALPDRQIFGFDSFAGLPEAWGILEPKGAFAQPPPQVPVNVELVIGLFSESLPAFAAVHSEPVSLIHIDCDLYSSTREIFQHIGGQIVPGTVIVFDEYWNYPGWRKHEFRAFQEFVAERELEYRYEAFVTAGWAVCVVVGGG